MDKLDLKDKKIIYELDLDSKKSSAQIGRKVELSKEVTNYRINNLVKKGFIKYFYTVLNTLALGYYHYKIYLKLQNATPKIEEEIINYFLENKNCIWLGSCSGNWDLAVSLLAKNPTEFTELYQKVVIKYGDYVLEKNILIIDKAPTFNRAYFSDKINVIEFEYKTKGEKVELDDIDKKILSLITINSRINIVELMNKLNLSRDIVSYRIKKMRKLSIIQGFRTAFNLDKLGYKYYKVLFTFKNINSEKENNFIKFCKQSKNIVQYIKLVGNWDAEVEFEVTDDLKMHELLLSIRLKFSDIIRNTEQLLIYEKKLNYYPF